MKIVTAEQIQRLDTLAINTYGIPGLRLMENAGQETVTAIINKYGDPAEKIITIVVGPGNNGGDGLVIARLLHQIGARPKVFLLTDPKKLSGDAAINYTRLTKLPVPVHNLPAHANLQEFSEEMDKSWLIVDSLFGTGLTRNINGHFADVIKIINQKNIFTIAVDIPSGLCSDRGIPLGACIDADLTVTFALPKIGQVIYPGKDYVGELLIVDIGIPDEAVSQIKIQQELLDSDIRTFLPRRPAASHKGTFGHLLVVAGSTGKTGAAILCAEGGLRCGTGLVTLCVPHDLNLIFETSLWEAMTIPMPSADGFLSLDDAPLLESAALDKKAIVMGPGLGTHEKTALLVKNIYRHFTLPMVIDADALNILAEDIKIMTHPPAPRIITPHPGEMARLYGCSTSEVQENRIKIAREFAAVHNVYVVLKGAATIIAAPDQQIAVNSTGNPGMAAGGMGDVLSGIVGGLLAQGLPPWEASCLGVYWHGLAGDRLAAMHDGFTAGYLASEVAAELPFAFELLK